MTHDLAVPSSLAPGTYSLGVYLPDGLNVARGNLDARMAIRFANDDVAWWAPDGDYGVNVLGSVEVTGA